MTLLFYAAEIAITGYINPQDIAAVTRTKNNGIYPGIPYFHETPIPSRSNNYRNFPHQAPISVEKAENEWVSSPYQGAVIAEVGNNYQYRIIDRRERRASFVKIPEEQLKNIENGVHFFILDKNGTLHALKNADEALKRNNYLRIEKEMNKVITVEKKPLVSHVRITYEYWENGNEKTVKAEEFDLNGKIFSTLNTMCDENGEIINMNEVDSKDRLMSAYQGVRKNGIYAEKIIYNPETKIKTNHIIYFEDGNIENKNFDESGKLILVKEHDEPEKHQEYKEEEPYKSLPIDTSKKYLTE